MATYMYNSNSGRNWDDDDDFEIDTYKATTDFSAPTIDDLGPLQRAPAGAEEEEYEFQHFNAPVPRNSTVDYSSISRYQWPSPALATMELWNRDKHRRPAYIEMSYEGSHACPDQRRNYNTNWLCTKVYMRCSMKLPIMMKPSPLQQSMTWEEDSESEYIKEAGFLFLSTSIPVLFQDCHSEDGQDESRTPPDSPPMVTIGEGKNQVEEGTVTATVEMPTNSGMVDELGISREFVNLNHVSDTLDVFNILEDAVRNIEHPYYDQAGSLISYIPPGSPSPGDMCEEVILEAFTTSSITAEDGRIRRDSGVDLMTVNGMAHNLIAIVKAMQAYHEIGDMNVEETIMITPIAVPDAESRVGDDVAGVHEAARLIESIESAQAPTGINTTAVEAVHTILTAAESRIDVIIADNNRFQVDNSNRTYAPGDCPPPTKSTTPSPDPKYIHDPAKTSLAWSTVVVSWFAISPVPWRGIAIAAARALVDVGTFMAHR